jgi:hypothetical protein
MTIYTDEELEKLVELADTANPILHLRRVAKLLLESRTSEFCATKNYESCLDLLEAERNKVDNLLGTIAIQADRIETLKNR